VHELSRRRFICVATAAGVCAKVGFADHPRLLIGVTDWNLKLGAKPEAVPLAASLGFSGVQVSFGRALVEGKLPVDNPQTIAQYLKLSAENHIPIDGTCVDRLHDNGLKSDPLAPQWIHDSIRLTKSLHSRVLLLPCSGRWSLNTQAEMDYAGDVLRELAPEAEKAGVVLGLEDLISAKDNVRILERSHSENVKVYYDVGNSTQYGFDPIAEIPWLGKDRICQFHLKDNPHYLGEGPIQFTPILEAIHSIGFDGYANLETDSPSGQLDADMRRNLNYIRGLQAKT
jgi:L-ribulose-5-phosphate 3-epimerase